MQSPLQSQSKLKSIHLLRALLREVTYLPDAYARRYFADHILLRFRAYQPSQDGVGSPRAKRRNESMSDVRTRALQRTAQKGLNYLRRANSGELPCLWKILLLTYGRMGRRRYALVNHLLKPDLSVAEKDDVVSAVLEPSPLQKCYHSEKRFLSFFEAPHHVSATHLKIEISDRYPRLKAVLGSQAARDIGINRPIKRGHIQRPIYNVWERPMPIKRARNDVRRWYADTMAKLLPPLPDAEWDRLRSLATGEITWSESVARRTLIAEPDIHPLQQVTHSQTLLEEALVLNKPSKADRPAGKQRPHAITPHFMRRLYSKLFVLCSKIEWLEQRKAWVVHWGSARDVSPRAHAVPVDDVLFAGVDNEGRVSEGPCASGLPS